MASISIFTPFFHRATTFLNSFVFAVNLIHFFLWHLSSAQKYFWADEEGIFFAGSSKAGKSFYFNTNMRSCPSLNCVSLLYFGYLKNFLHFLWLPFLLKRFLLKFSNLILQKGSSQDPHNLKLFRIYANYHTSKSWSIYEPEGVCYRNSRSIPNYWPKTRVASI